MGAAAGFAAAGVAFLATGIAFAVFDAFTGIAAFFAAGDVSNRGASCQIFSAFNIR